MKPNLTHQSIDGASAGESNILPPDDTEDFPDSNTSSSAIFVRFSLPYMRESSSLFLELNEDINETNLAGQMAEAVNGNVDEPDYNPQTYSNTFVSEKKPRYLQLISWRNISRTRRKTQQVIIGHNFYGRKGKKRCLQCRKWKQKVYDKQASAQKIVQI